MRSRSQPASWAEISTELEVRRWACSGEVAEGSASETANEAMSALHSEDDRKPGARKMNGELLTSCSPGKSRFLTQVGFGHVG